MICIKINEYIIKQKYNKSHKSRILSAVIYYGSQIIK